MNTLTENDRLDRVFEKITATIVKRRQGSEVSPEAEVYKIDEKYFVKDLFNELEIIDAEAPLFLTPEFFTPLIQIDPSDYKWAECSIEAVIVSGKMSDLFTEVLEEDISDATDQYGNARFTFDAPFVRLDKKREDVFGTRQRIQNESFLRKKVK
ncbi:MAG: hypothetical protein V4478_03930 [Patescibacteria group bacterium]